MQAEFHSRHEILKDIQPQLRYPYPAAWSVSSSDCQVRRAFDGIAVNLDGAPAATGTVVRKRAVLHNCLQYAVEREHFATNPLHNLPDAECYRRRWSIGGSSSTPIRPAYCWGWSATVTPSSRRSSPAWHRRSIRPASHAIPNLGDAGRSVAEAPIRPP